MGKCDKKKAERYSWQPCYESGKLQSRCPQIGKWLKIMLIYMMVYYAIMKNYMEKHTDEGKMSMIY